MPANVITTGVQIGQSGTAANNFTVRTLDDGSLRISRGNAGAETSDVLVIDVNGNFTTAPVLGIGQTWQNVTASRAAGTTYTNTTGRTIAVSVVMRDQGGYFSEGYVNGVKISAWDQPSAITYTLFFIVPPAHTYMVSGNAGSAGGNTVELWAELR